MGDKKPKAKTNNKSKGSSFERELAKILSIWIYGAESVLRRHPTSGAEKGFGSGADISLFQPGYDPFEYFVEAKRGYKDDIFNARKQILEWYETAKPKNKNNYPIWIIWKVLNRGILIATDKELINVHELYRINNLFIYDFKELIQNDFKSVTGKKILKKLEERSK